MARRKGKELDTRAALIDAAWALFQDTGYDATSVDAIVARAKLSKGTFFHYFPTKVALLEAVCDEVTREGWSALTEELAARPRDALSQLNLLIQGMRAFRLTHVAAIVHVYRALARDDNAPLRARLMQRLDGMFVAPMREVIVAGNAEGVFHVAEPEQVARFVGALLTAAGEQNMELLAREGVEPSRSIDEVVEVVMRRSEALSVAIERLLGAAPGSLVRQDRALVRQGLLAARS
jgi:AcrR family transcriptional regulator